MACRDWAAKVGGGVLGRVWALVAALALLLGLIAMAPAPAQAASFRDVPSGQWYTSWVDQASDQGLMSGFTDPATGRPTGYFGPDEPLTRAQVATVLWRMAGGPSSGHASFPDVERGSWYDAPVAWCVKAGVVTGYTSGPDKGCFRPNRPVTRQELATMVYRYAKYAGMDVADPDPSAFRSTADWRTADSWASDALTWTAAAGVLSGVDNHDGTYSVVPFGTATRAMAAKVFVVLSGSPSAAKASYTVTFNSNGGSAVKAQAVKNGAKASKPADPAKSGYAFKGWCSDKSLTKAYDFNSTVKSNLTLYAKWEAKATYTVTFVSNGGTAVEAQSVSSGARASKPANPTRAGHAFKGWYSDKSLTKAYDFNSAVKSNLTLYAKWEANEYTVTFVSNGGTSVAKQAVSYGARASRPSDPTLEGSQFAGWYTNAACTEAYDFGSAVKSDLALYAKWEKKATYTVTFDANGGTAVKAQSVSSGAKAFKPADPAKAGHAFKGWYSDKSLAKAYDFNSAVESDLTLYARWEANEYTVTFVSNGGTSVAKQAVAYGARASEPADPALDGCEFAGWYVDDACTEAYDFDLPVKANLTLYAKWEAIRYTVTFVSNGGPSIAAQVVSYGESAVKPADPAWNGYDFMGWHTDDSFTEAYDFSLPVTSNLILYAKWEIKPQPYAILYKDGLLSLQVGSDTDSSHGKVLGKWEWDGSSYPWYDKRARVRFVIARDGINVSSGSSMFRDLENCRSMNLSKLDVSCAVSLSDMFSGCSSLQSLDLSTWDVSGAADLSGMFCGCSSLQSLDLSAWDVSGATDLFSMFYGCSSLQSLDISTWDVSGASNFFCMFCDCSGLESLDLSDWDVSGASDLYAMFSGCSSLQSLDLSDWDVSGVPRLADMFYGCSSLQSLEISDWDISGATDLSSMFSGCSSLRSLDLSGWDVSNVMSFNSEGHGTQDYDGNMFYGCSSLQSLDLSGWDVSSANDLSGMFSGCSSLQSLDLSGWDVFGVPNLSSLFLGCSSLTTLDISDWDVSGTSNLCAMFVGCSSLQSLDLSTWDVSDASSLSSMFSGCSSLQSLDLSDWDVSAATDFSFMFCDCSGLEYVDLSGWDVSGAVGFSHMFSGCSGLRTLDLSDWDVSDTAYLSFMFDGCSSLSTVTLGAGCGPLVKELPNGPWYDAEGNEYSIIPASVAGTFTKARPEVQAALVELAAEPGDAAVPSEPSTPEQPSKPDVPSVEPGEPSEPEVPAEPEVPSEPSGPEVPSEPSGPEVPSEPEAPATPEAPSESEEPSVEPAPDEGPSDDSAASDEADLASDSLELGEEPVSALAA